MVLGAAAILLPLVLLAGLVRSVLPSSAQARDGAQQAADRLAPGQLHVTSVKWRGEAGGYQVIATLTDPRTTITWTGDKTCTPGSICEERLRLQLATVREGPAEIDALRRAFAPCGVPLVAVSDVGYEPTAMLVGRREILAILTVTVPAPELDGPTRTPVADRLDACGLAWAVGRDGLLPVTRSEVTLSLAGTDGHVHSTTSVRVEDGRIRASAGDRVAPVLDTSQPSAFLTAIDAPLRAFLLERGITVTRIEGVEGTYPAGTTRRVDLEVTVSQRGPDPLAQLPTRRVLLTVDADGGNPTGLRFV